MTSLKKMKKAELIEVLEITARRHAELKKIVDGFQVEEFKKSVRRFCPGPAFKKTVITSQFCLEKASNKTN